jgi:hypothetical protein
MKQKHLKKSSKKVYCKEYMRQKQENITKKTEKPSWKVEKDTEKLIWKEENTITKRTEKLSCRA